MGFIWRINEYYFDSLLSVVRSGLNKIEKSVKAKENPRQRLRFAESG
jgi:hypothetical protein